MLMRIPAATAEPMTPATLGPMACISRKLEGFSLLADLLGDTGSHGHGGNAGGTDQGVDLAAGQRVHHLAAAAHRRRCRTEKAIRPSTMIEQGAGVEERVGRGGGSQQIVPRKMVMMFISSLLAVFWIRSTTPHSFIRLPSISIPTRAAASGTQEGNDDGDHDGEDDLLGLGDRCAAAPSRQCAPSWWSAPS